jgi:FkbM family methyltransferase
MLKSSLRRVLAALGYELRKKKKARLSLDRENEKKKISKVDFSTEEKFSLGFTKTSFGGNTYFVPEFADHRPASRRVARGELHEPSTHEFVANFSRRVGGSMVHAGASFGDMIPLFSKVVQGKVYAFEPVLENFLLAKLCLEENACDNVLLFNCALGDRIGNLKIDVVSRDGKHAGGASRIAAQGVICPSIAIDTLRDKEITLIQLDVEGYELTALKGAVDTIRDCRPVIAIEDNKDQCTEFLLGLDYELIGKSPYLHFWVPKENGSLKETVFDIISKFEVE